jgi:hypothetical protein
MAVILHIGEVHIVCGVHVNIHDFGVTEKLGCGDTGHLKRGLYFRVGFCPFAPNVQTMPFFVKGVCLKWEDLPPIEEGP